MKLSADIFSKKPRCPRKYFLNSFRLYKPLQIFKDNKSKESTTKMKISNVLALSFLATVQSAAIKPTHDALATDDITANVLKSQEMMDSPVLQSEKSIKENIPDWLMEFKQYIEDENEIDFDLNSFLDKLESNEADDFMDLLVFMIDLEFGDEDFETVANE